MRKFKYNFDINMSLSNIMHNIIIKYIGIIGLIVVSILLNYKILFYENGYPVFGDVNFLLPDILLRQNLTIWLENGMIYHGVWPLPRWILFYIISRIIGSEAFIKLGIVLAYSLPAIIAGLVISSIIDEYNSVQWYDKQIIVFIAGLAYISAPILINTGGFKFLGTLSNCIMISLPIFIYIAMKSRLELPKIIILAIIVMIFLGSPRELLFYIFYAFLTLLLIIPVYGISVFKLNLKHFLVFCVILIFLLSYTLIPYIMFVSYFKPLYLQSGGFSYVMLKVFSRNQELINSIRQMMKWWSVVDYSTNDILIHTIWFVSTWIIPILAFSSLMISIRQNIHMKKLATIFSFLTVITIFLVKGINPPFGEFYAWLVLRAPLPFGINWMFRDPSKFFVYLSFFYTFLIAITVHSIMKILSSSLIKKIIVILLLVTILISYSWPAYTGDMKGIFHLTPLPKDYIRLRDKITRTGNILWIPPSSGGRFYWSDVPLTPDPIKALSPGPYYNMAGRQRIIWDNIIRLVKTDDYKNFKVFLDLLGIKFIVLRYDNKADRINKIAYEFKNILKYLDRNEWIKKIYSGKYIDAYELTDNTSIIKAYFLNGIPVFLLFDINCNNTFSFRANKSGYYLLIIKSDKNITNNVILLNIDNKRIAYDYMNNYLYALIYLKAGNHIISIVPHIKLITSWNFETIKDVDLWKKYTPSRPFNSLQLCFWDKHNKALKVMLFNSTWGWKTINSPPIPVKYGYKYIIKFSVKAKNAYMVHYKIIEYNSHGKIVHSVYGGGIGDGTFNWKNITYIYSPVNPNTTYIQIQIWHGHLTNKPLPNIIWIKNVKIYEYKPVICNIIQIDWIRLCKQNDEGRVVKELIYNVNNIGNIVNLYNYKKIDPALWEVKINTRRPFLLVFSEAYDPLWRANVYKNNMFIGTVESIPIFGMINGFWINATGNLTVVIRYLPQDWFELGLRISGATFALCVFYLFWDWRRGRGDRWALWLERWFKKMSPGRLFRRGSVGRKRVVPAS